MFSSEEPLYCQFQDKSCSHTCILDLPWHDVIFRHILPCLTLQNQVQLRRVSRDFKEMLTEFFRTNIRIDISRYAGRMNQNAFTIITRDNFSLQKIVLRNAKDWLKDDVLYEILVRNNRLQRLDLTNCYSVSNDSLQVLAVNCLGLCTLVLQDCHWVSVEGLTAVAMSCQHLGHVDLTGCWNINDDAIILLVLSCKKIEYLSLSKIYGVTDYSVSILARESPCLRHLNIQGCWRLSDDSVRLIGEYCPKLMALQARECRDVTEASLARLRVKGVKIDVLPPPNLKRLSNLTNSMNRRLNIQI